MTSKLPSEIHLANPKDSRKHLTIRHAAADELPALAAFVFEQAGLAYCINQDLGPKGYYQTEAYRALTLPARKVVFDNESCITLVATREAPSDQEEEIVGIIEFGPTRAYADVEGRDDIPEWELWCVYVDASTRGTRLGQRLVREALRCMLGMSDCTDPSVTVADEATPMRMAWESPTPVRMRRGDSFCVLTLKGNAAQDFYEKMGGKLKWDLPNYPVADTVAPVIALEFGPAAIERLLV